LSPAALNSSGDIISLMLPAISGGAECARSAKPNTTQSPSITYRSKGKQQIFIKNAEFADASIGHRSVKHPAEEGRQLKRPLQPTCQHLRFNNIRQYMSYKIGVLNYNDAILSFHDLPS
jgi:hypothetical protein